MGVGTNRKYSFSSTKADLGALLLPVPFIALCSPQSEFTAFSSSYASSISLRADDRLLNEFPARLVALFQLLAYSRESSSSAQHKSLYVRVETESFSLRVAGVGRGLQTSMPFVAESEDFTFERMVRDMLKLAKNVHRGGCDVPASWTGNAA
jgi:hypothetical protein